MGKIEFVTNITLNKKTSKLMGIHSIWKAGRTQTETEEFFTTKDFFCCSKGVFVAWLGWLGLPDIYRLPNKQQRIPQKLGQS